MYAPAPPPATATATADPGGQSSFENPVTNMGDFEQQVPIIVPPGINGLTPEIALAYSSRSGLGNAGVGWQMPAPAIVINLADGYRPSTLEKDLARYAPNTPVERYSSNFGTLAVVQSSDNYATSNKTYVFNPSDDSRIEPIADETGATEIGGDKAAWEVTLKNGTHYRYGFTADSSLVKDDSTDSSERRKVAWYLDQVEDAFGNLMIYRYEPYPGNQDTYRQPVLRTIEYGIPASNPSTDQRLVVELNYTQSPWKRTSYIQGTRTDYAYVVKSVCRYARAVVQSATTAGGHQRWLVSGPGAQMQLGCTEMTYNFEDVPTYGAGYTGRPLLVKVEPVGQDGSRLPGWRFDYTDSHTAWQSVYAGAVAAGGTGDWTTPEDTMIDYESHDVEHLMADVNGDGIGDFVHGAPTGGFPVQVGRDAQSGLGYADETWPNPLSTAAPAQLEATAIDADKDGPDANCWWNYLYDLQWSAGTGLGYAEALTAAPANFWDAYLNSGGHDELESANESLGAFQYLHSSYYGPFPALGKRDAIDPARTISELEVYGAYFDNRDREYGFDLRSSDCQDAGEDFGMDTVDIDYCWNAGTGGAGMLGADLACFDAPEPRWFTAAKPTDDPQARGYNSDLWTLNDLDGDGRLDIVYAANVIERTSDGTLRDFAGGANDWYWARGTGTGWETPRPWRVPSKQPALAGVDHVNGSGMLSVAVSTNDLRALKSDGIGLSASIGVNGFTVSPTVMLNGNSIGLPTSFSANAINGLKVGVPNLRGLAGWAASSVKSQAVGAAAASVSPQTAAVYFNATASASSVNAAANGTGGLSVGLGVRTWGKQIRPYLELPFIGDVIGLFRTEETSTTSYTYQTAIDLNADGRPDQVTSRYDAGASANAADRWLVARNSGTGFDDPAVAKFASTPETDAIGASTTYNYTKHILQGTQLTTIPFGSVEQQSGLVDLNADGLLDLVWGPGQVQFDHATGIWQQGWTVYFNQGGAFSEGVWWPFQGDWQADETVGGCTSVTADPLLSRSVYGFSDNFNIGDAQSREVMRVMDVNGDGLPDFVYERPAPLDVNDPTHSACDYVRKDLKFTNTDTLLDRTSPDSLHEGMRVRLNTGFGFGPPIDWVDDSGFALAGGKIEIYLFDHPNEKHSWSTLAVGDFDDDGAPDLARHLGERPSWSNDDGDGVEPWKLYKLADGNVDTLNSVTNPDGGHVDVTYRWDHVAGGEMGAGQWVVGSYRVTDSDPARVDVTRTLQYEHAVYDRDYRAFMGYERVYQYSTENQGYTMSRYYQQRGFEGRLYCREVRSTSTSGEAAVATTRAAHEAAWASGETPAGYSPAVAIGDVATAGTIPSQQGYTDDDAAGGDPGVGGTTPDDVSAWGDPPATEPTDDPAEDQAEIDRENGAPDYSPPFVDAPTNDITRDITTTIPLDSDQPGPGPNWTPDGGGHTNWWDWPFYEGDCTPGLSPDGTVLFTCAPDDVSTLLLGCGSPSDDGVIVQQEFQINGDHSGIPGVHTPRLDLTATFRYDHAGVPTVTQTSNTYDGYGNITEIRDSGDTSTIDDDVVTTTQYAVNDSAYVVGLPCHSVVSHDGEVLAENWNGYDGGAADGSCTMPITGALTATKRAISATESATESFEYTPEGLISRHVDPRGHATTTAYYPGFPWLKLRESIDVTNATGPTQSQHTWLYYGLGATTYHFGLIAADYDWNLDGTAYDYDAFDRPISVVKPGDSVAEPTTRYTYLDWAVANTTPLVPRGALAEHKIGVGRYVSSTTFHDGFGHKSRTETTPPDNLAGCAVGACVAITAEQTFDLDGRVLSLRDPYFGNQPDDAHYHTTAYDLLGRVVSVTGPNGATSVNEYDGLRTTMMDPEGQVSVRIDDARGNTVASYRYLDAGATFYSQTLSTYRADGKLTTTTDSLGNTWTFTYDQLGRTVAATDPDKGDSNTVFDASGNPIIETDSRYATVGLVTQTAYDEMNRAVARSVRIGATVNGATVTGGTIIESTVWVFDVDPGTLPGHTLACPTNTKGRLSRVGQWQLVGGALTKVSDKEYCYDDRGRISDTTQTINTTPYTFHYTYTPHDEIATATQPDGDVITNDYDDAGRIRKSRNLGGALLKASYVNASNLPVLRKLGPKAIRQDFCYQPGYAAAGVVRRQVTGATAVTCGDTTAADTVTGTPIDDLTYEYSPSGLVDSRAETYKDPTAGLVTADSDYDYDDTHRLVAESVNGLPASTFAYDEIDNLTQMNGVDQTYGDSSRSVGNAGPNAITATSTGTTFTYDPAGNTSSIVTPTASLAVLWSGSNRPVTILNGGVVAEQLRYDEAGNRVWKNTPAGDIHYAGAYRVSPTAIETFYPGVGMKVTAGATSKNLFVISDPLKSSSVVIDSNGAVLEAVNYEPYGRIRSQRTTSPFETDYLYNGKEQDDAFAGLAVYDYGARLYLADVGRWLSVDNSFADGLDRYAYVRDNPTSQADPTGRGGIPHYSSMDDIRWWESFWQNTDDLVQWTPIASDLRAGYIMLTGQNYLTDDYVDPVEQAEISKGMLLGGLVPVGLPVNGRTARWVGEDAVSTMTKRDAWLQIRGQRIVSGILYDIENDPAELAKVVAMAPAQFGHYLEGKVQRAFEADPFMKEIGDTWTGVSSKAQDWNVVSELGKVTGWDLTTFGQVDVHLTRENPDGSWAIDVVIAYRKPK